MFYTKSALSTRRHVDTALNIMKHTMVILDAIAVSSCVRCTCAAVWCVVYAEPQWLSEFFSLHWNHVCQKRYVKILSMTFLVSKMCQNFI